MGILDALRGRKSGNNDDDSSGDIGPGDPAAPDPMQFRPRTDGVYLTGSDGVQSDGLQFGAGRVREVIGVTDPEAARQALGRSEVRSGEYTGSGRFSLSKPFEMLVAFTVIETGDDFFRARRTSAQDGSSTELHYRFEPWPPVAADDR